jgi:hypothetical protein
LSDPIIESQVSPLAVKFFQRRMRHLFFLATWVAIREDTSQRDAGMYRSMIEVGDRVDFISKYLAIKLVVQETSPSC